MPPVVVTKKSAPSLRARSLVQDVRNRPVLPAALGAASISCSAILVRLADVGAGTTAFYRCLFALPGLALLATLETRRLGKRDIRLRARALAAGVFLCIDLILWTHAIYDVGAGIATVLGNLQVLFVAAVAWIAFGERPSARFALALPAVMCGVVLVAGLAGSSRAGYHPVAGIFYGLGTSIAYGAYILVLRQTTSTTRHVAGPLADATFGAAVASLAVGLSVGEMRFGAPIEALGWLLILALVSQTFGWLLITSALPRLPASISSLLLLLQPASSLVLAAIVLSQRPTLLQVLGAALVCGGVLFATRSRRQPGKVRVEPTPG